MERRIAKVLLSPESIKDLLTADCPVNKEGIVRWFNTDLPKDTRVLHVEWDFSSEWAVLICESSEFELVKSAEGSIPLLPTRTVSATIHVEPYVELLSRLNKEE